MRAFFMAAAWFKLVIQLTVKQAPPWPLAGGLKIPAFYQLAPVRRPAGTGPPF